MRIISGGKAFGFGSDADRQFKASFGEKFSAFFGEDNGDSDRSFGCDCGDCDSDDNCNEIHDPNQRSIYWESQELLLQEIVERYSSTGSNLRQEISRVIELARESDVLCICSKPNSDACFNCLRQKVVKLLCNKGFNATLCTPRWKQTKKLPGGMHEYIEVVARTSGRKKEIILVVELEFRDQFEIAKASKEYHKLVNGIPKYYIGKPDHLNAIVRVICEAAKRSMKEKKIHLGPWRKTNFMLMKWSSSYERQIFDESSNECFSFLSSQVDAPLHNNSCLPFSAAQALVVT